MNGPGSKYSAALTIFQIYEYITSQKILKNRKIRIPFTLMNTGNGKKVWYRVERANTKYNNRWLVHAHMGSDSWKYIGKLEDRKLHITSGSKVDSEHKLFKCFQWLMYHVREGKSLPSGYKLYHWGICGHDERPLNKPHAQRLGFNVGCYDKLHS